MIEFPWLHRWWHVIPLVFNHLMSGVINKTSFGFSGEMPHGKLTHSLLEARVATPMLKQKKLQMSTFFLRHHDACTWDSDRDLIELCSGMGGMGQGLMSVGFRPVVACDSNPLMLGLYQIECCHGLR